MTLMRGVTGVRQMIAAHLSVEMPTLIDIARAQWGLAEHLLPYPTAYDSYDPLKVDNGQYPLVGSVASRMPRLTRMDVDNLSEEEYNFRYSMRVFIWTRTPFDPVNGWVTPEYDSCLQVRDDLAAILRASLLRWPSLGTAGADQPLVKVEETTLNEDYFDAMAVGAQNDRWVAGAGISVDVDVSESTYHEQLGTADTILTDVGILPQQSVGD